MFNSKMYIFYNTMRLDQSESLTEIGGTIKAANTCANNVAQFVCVHVSLCILLCFFCFFLFLQIFQTLCTIRVYYYIETRYCSTLCVCVQKFYYQNVYVECTLQNRQCRIVNIVHILDPGRGIIFINLIYLFWILDSIELQC